MGYCFLYESKVISSGTKLNRLYHPVRIALSLCFLLILGFISGQHIAGEDVHYAWISVILPIALILYLVNEKIRLFNVESVVNKGVIFGLTLLMLIPVANSPLTIGALCLLLLSFKVNFKPGIALGIVAFIYGISQFYYDLSISLLIKSILLFSSGAVFIVLYLFTTKNLRDDEKI